MIEADPIGHRPHGRDLPQQDVLKHILKAEASIDSNIRIHQYVAVQEQIKLLKALGDETRMRIVQCLLDGERCACKLVPAVGRAQPTVSQHLRILEEAGVLESWRKGVNIWYRIRSDKAVRILEILEIPKIEIPDTCEVKT